MHNKYIGCNKEHNFGQPSLKGRRLCVYDIITKIYYENNLNIAIEDYQITLLEAKAAIKYCMNLSCQKDQDLAHYCHGCLLRTLHEGSNFNKDDYFEITNEDNNKIVISKNGKEFFLGTIEEMENKEFGKITWLLAEKLNKLIL